MASISSVLCYFCCFMLLIKICVCHPLQNNTKCEKIEPQVHLLCESPLFYPEKAISRLLKRKQERFQFLSGTVITPTNLTDEDIFPQLKFDETENYKNLCDTKQTSYTPKSGFDTNGIHRFIVNVPDFKQIIIFETCLNESKSCVEDLPMGYRRACQQKYSTIRLLTYTGKTAVKKYQMEYVTFRVPSTCVCTETRENIF